MTPDLHKESPQIQILANSAFSINALYKYVICHLRYAHHPHKEILRHASALVKTRAEKGLLTHIWKVKSHTGVAYNDEANAGARGVVDGDIVLDITFTNANPVIVGLLT